jgi:hypothetical protein
VYLRKTLMMMMNIILLFLLDDCLIMLFSNLIHFLLFYFCNSIVPVLMNVSQVCSKFKSYVIIFVCTCVVVCIMTNKIKLDGLSFRILWVFLRFTFSPEGLGTLENVGLPVAMTRSKFGQNLNSRRKTLMMMMMMMILFYE